MEQFAQQAGQLLSWDTVLVAVGLASTAGLWLYTHFSKATQAQQAQRVSVVATLVSYAYHATADVAAKTDATWDDRLAAVLGKVDTVLAAQGGPPMDLGEKAKAALQVAALTGAQKAGSLAVATTAHLPTTPR